MTWYPTSMVVNYETYVFQLLIGVILDADIACQEKKFGSDHAFMPKRAFLSFDEIEKVVKSCKKLGLQKVRITGGEPLLRPNLPDLVKKLSKLDLDIALTTNASLLRKHAKELSEAGLNRVTVSLDALDQDIHSKMTDSNTSVDTILDGIDAAIEFGLTPIKVNCVVQKGVNESEVKKLVDHFRNTEVIVRFIEYMDVGRTNGWMLGQVIPSSDIINYLQKYFDLNPLDSESSSDVANRWAHSDGSGEIGVISSVSSPFVVIAFGHVYLQMVIYILAYLLREGMIYVL